MRLGKKMAIAIVVFASLLLVGCGTQLTELTSEQEENIVTASAQAVGRFNANQEHAYTPLTEEVATNALELEAVKQARINGTVSGSTAVSENDGDGTASDTSSTADSSTEADLPIESTLRLDQLLGETDIRIEYQGAQVVDSYSENTSYEVLSKLNNSILVMKFTLTNIMDTEIALDLMGKAKYQVEMASGYKAVGLITLLDSDLSTYVSKIGAKESRTVVLLFEIAESEGVNLDKITLYANTGDGLTAVLLQ